jgi:hypothetical protein
MRAVGLHFAGSDDLKCALAMDIEPLLDALNVSYPISYQPRIVLASLQLTDFTYSMG